MSIISIESVSRNFGHSRRNPSGLTAVADFSLRLEKGERVALLGPSGCGKSTILRMIAGFIPPEKGRILIDGRLASAAGRILMAPERRDIGMVFQDLALWPHLSVERNLELGLAARGVSALERDRRIADLLHLMEMDENRGAMPSELSGGQQQRIALARALILQPRIVLMDEPLSNLDIELNLKLRGEIRGLQEMRGFTLLYVTHDLDEAVDIGTRIVIMRQGRIELTGGEREARAYFARIAERSHRGKSESPDSGRS